MECINATIATPSIAASATTLHVTIAIGDVDAVFDHVPNVMKKYVHTANMNVTLV